MPEAPVDPRQHVAQARHVDAAAVPAPSTVSEIDGKLWFGSTRGAFMKREDGKFNYYASRRWLPSDRVVDIEKGPENSVLVLSAKGLAQIFFCLTVAIALFTSRTWQSPAADPAVPDTARTHRVAWRPGLA